MPGAATEIRGISINVSYVQSWVGEARASKDDILWFKVYISEHVCLGLSMSLDLAGHICWKSEIKTGDVKKGKIFVQKCVQYHTTESTTNTKNHGLFGQKLDQSPGFSNTDANENKSITWGEANLEKP